MQNRKFSSASPKKCPRGWNFSRFFALMFRTKNNISYKKFEFFDKGRIKYELLTRLKIEFKTRKHQNVNLEIEFWSGFLQTALKKVYRGSVKFRRILNKFRFILIFRPKRVKSQ